MLWQSISRDAFLNPDNDMFYGWLVPLVSLAVAWALRKKLCAAAGRPAWVGIFLLAPMFALSWSGRHCNQPQVSQLAMLLSVPAVTWVGLGRSVARVLLFPTTFLLLIVPIAFLDVIASFLGLPPFTVSLRVVVAVLSTGLLNGLGVETFREGMFIESPSGLFQFYVADVCSGLRSIAAIIMLTAAYGFAIDRHFA